MLGSLSEADDAVQEAWLRLSRADTSDVENLGGWLTTVVARVCLDMLRSRKSRREEPLGAHVPDPIVEPQRRRRSRAGGAARRLGRARAAGRARDAGARRAAGVRAARHVRACRSTRSRRSSGARPTAARQLASRARRRVQGAAAVPDADLARQREVVDAFLAAARDGDFDALLARARPRRRAARRRRRAAAGASTEIRGARPWPSRRAAPSRSWRRLARPALVNGAAGVVVARDGRPFSVMGFTVRGGKIVEIDILADPERLRHVGLSLLSE